jgi:hypothetical protein
VSEQWKEEGDLLLTDHSVKSHAMAPKAEARKVLRKAFVAIGPAERAEPALKPNHPTQSIQVPITVKRML